MRGLSPRRRTCRMDGMPMAVLACALALLFPAVQAGAEDLPTFSCAQGKPHFCYKQGQGTCRKNNARPDAQAACELWTEACVECQAAITNCFERSAEPVFEGSAECTACHAELTACMAAVDKEYWPNRQQRKEQ